MTPAKMPATALLSGEGLWISIARDARRAPGGRRYLAVAFLGAGATSFLKLEEEDLLIVNCTENSVRDGACDPREVRKYLESGIDVHVLESLHAKVYVLGNAAYIGSANASRRAYSYNEEAAIRTTDRRLVSSARRFVEGLLDDPRVLPAELTELTRLERLRPTRTGGSSTTARPRIPTVAVPPEPFRLWVVATPWERPDRMDEAASREQDPHVQRRARRSRFLVQPTWFHLRDWGRLPFAKGDVIVEVTCHPSTETPLSASFLGEVVALPARYGSRSDRRLLVYVRSPRDLRAIRWSEFQRVAARAGLREVSSGDCRRVRGPTERGTIVRAFGLSPGRAI